MSKRSRSRDDKNPLSSARKDSGSSAVNRSSSTNKADQNASALWHRKSGAGYHLFLSYYGSQPLGVVVANVDDVDGNIIDSVVRKDGSSRSSNNKSNKGNIVSGGAGMSRAAKRRRQKQNKSSATSNNEEGKQCEASSNSSCNGYDYSNTQKQFDESHPLIQAFNSSLRSSSDNQHLTNFVYALSRPLPLTLRFRQHNVTSSSTAELKQQLATYYSEYIKPVSYDPTNNIYQSTTNSSLCKSNLKKLSPKLKELIVNGSMDGTIARQELGSMLPVISLQCVGAIQRGSKVLDLCASPGSKTLQALEIVCGNNSANNNNGSSSNSKKMGRVIANDVHSGRLDSLREAVLRSGMPESLTSRVTYTNFDASTFPYPKSGKLMDAIICDVPCGGDGTIRKDPHILPMWSPNISNTIHKLQLKILLRALQLVKVGGVVCYSTCSLNPVEDEAVVSAALREGNNNCDDDEEGDNNAKFELLELPANMLPGFIRRPGVCNWKVASYDKDNVNGDDDDDFGSLSFYDNYETALTSGMLEDVKSTYWPNVTENKRMGLDRCTRLLPQDHDTGGFFLSLIRRRT